MARSMTAATRRGAAGRSTAGCSAPELLGHLRGPGPHVQGCWAVDLTLGKE
jgi:hypothetical protein